jgi:flagellar biosynthesis anti-sigma factor FlgM
MRLTDHTPTSRPRAIPAGPHAALPPPDPATAEGAARPLASASATGERSSQARDLHRAWAVAQAAPEVRLAEVEAARRALQEGTLTLDGQTLAEKLLQAACTERRHAGAW